MMAAYSMRGTEEKSPKRRDVEARQHIRQFLLPGVQDAVQEACQPGGPQPKSIDVCRPFTRMTNANDEIYI